MGEGPGTLSRSALSFDRYAHASPPQPAPGMPEELQELLKIHYRSS
jgi:hypothetical protein